MIEALIAGERDPAGLGELARGRMRSKRDELAEALAGRFRAPHATMARRILDHVDFLDRSVVELVGPFGPAVELLSTIPGWAPRRPRCSSPRPAAR